MGAELGVGNFRPGRVAGRGPGPLVVESSDGFSRKERAEWDVEHISVGDQTWTLAHPI